MLPRFAFSLLKAVACILVAATSLAVAAFDGSQTATHALRTDGLRSLGPAPTQNTVSLALGLRMQNRPAFDDFMHHLTTWGDGAFGKTISRDEFVSRYAPTERQAQQVVDFLTRAGFSHVELAPNRLLVTAEGTVGVAEEAFNTRIEQFDLGSRLAIGNVSDAQVSKALGDLVLGIAGLQTVHQRQPMNLRATARPQAVTGHNPVQFAHIYGADGTPTGSGYAAGIITSGKMDQTLIDLSTFASDNSLTLPPVQVIYVGRQGGSSSGTSEWDIDSQDILGTAGTVKKLYFYAATSLSDAPLEAAENKAVSDNFVVSINESLGECETSAYTSGALAVEDQIYAEAVAQGQTFFISSGDSGSKECGSSGGTVASWPSTSPYVVAVGGTTLTTTANNDWAGETAWSGSGGGLSLYEKAPDWQSAVVPTTMRAVPDIAADADPNSGALVIINGRSEQYGGTSLAAPISTGASTRLWSYYGSPTYFLAPLIYSYLSTFQNGTYHDVISGSNGAYSAAPGFDYVTGFGSWNIYYDIGPNLN